MPTYTYLGKAPAFGGLRGSKMPRIGGAMVCAVRPSPLLDHIRHIVCVRAPEQVIVSAAWRVVAGMARFHTGTVPACCQDQCVTMSGNRLAVNHKVAVPFAPLTFRSQPRPATVRIRPVYLCPKTLLRCAVGGVKTRSRAVQGRVPIQAIWCQLLAWSEEISARLTRVQDNFGARMRLHGRAPIAFVSRGRRLAHARPYPHFSTPVPSVRVC